MKPRESKMLNRVRRWRKEAYQADKTKTLSEQAKEGEELARKFGLPIAVTGKANSAHRK